MPKRTLLATYLFRFNIRQIDLAKYTGIEKGKMSRIINGKAPVGLADALTIAKWLGVNINEIFDINEVN